MKSYRVYAKEYEAEFVEAMKKYLKPEEPPNKTIHELFPELNWFRKLRVKLFRKPAFKSGDFIYLDTNTNKLVKNKNNSRIVGIALNSAKIDETVRVFIGRGAYRLAGINDEVFIDNDTATIRRADGSQKVMRLPQLFNYCELLKLYHKKYRPLGRFA